MRSTILGPLFVVLAVVACNLASASEDAGITRIGPNPLAPTLGPRITVLEHDHGDVSPWLEFFTFDSRCHPKLVQLREQYKLDELVQGCHTDLERALALT